MTMKIKNFMMLLALTGLAAGCSNDDLTEGGGDENPTGARSEIQLSFSGTGESEEYNRSRAIASESENQIDKLSVYLFASNAQNGTYYYLETWEEGKAYDAATNPTGFKKQASGTGWKASIYPHELKGLPYIKLLCVANNTDGGATTDGKFYEEDGTTEVLSTLTKVTVDADGTVTNSAAATTEALFRTTYSKALAKNEANGIIDTPLLMTGEGQTKISGSVSKVNIDLKRIMARFDIDNTTSRSNLTITKVTMVHGRPTGALFGAAPTKVEKADLDTDTKIMEYQPINFTLHTGANQGLAESALYVYPTLATDESYLKVEGTYKSPITSEQVPVTYNIPIVRTADGSPKGEYLPIKANSRYKLRISDVTQSNIFGTFEVQDWTSGGGINVKPDNDAPIFDDATAFSGTNAPKALTDADGTVYGYEVTGTDGTGNFDLTIAATGKVRAEKGEIARAIGDTDWLTISPANPNYEEKDGVWYSKFNISYTDAIGKQPVAVTFINDAASYDPALWTTINFYGPKAVPSFAVLDDPNNNGNAPGNVTKVDAGTKAPAASIYAVTNSYVQFNVTCIEGVTVDQTTLAAATGYKVEEVKTEGFVHTYKISVSDAAQVKDGTATIKFQNTGDTSKETTLTITKLDPAMKATQVSVAPAGAVTADFTATPNTLKVDMDIMTSYSFKVDAPYNLVLADNALTACAWLTITETHAWQDSDGERYAQYSVIPKVSPANTDPYTLTFTNGLTDVDKNIIAPALELKITKDFSKPKLEIGTTTAQWSTFNQGLTSNFTDPYAVSIEMYLVNESAVTVKMSCDEAAAFEAVEGLTMEETSSKGEYKITVSDASKFDAKTPTELTVYNTPAKDMDAGTNRKATLTINWKSAAITASLTKNDYVEESGPSDAPVYTVDVANLSNFTFTVTAGGGATTDLSVLNGTFLKLHSSNVGDATLDAGVGEAYMLRVDDDTQKSDITMTFTNSIANGGNLTITFKVKP